MTDFEVVAAVAARCPDATVWDQVNWRIEVSPAGIRGGLVRDDNSGIDEVFYPLRTEADRDAFVAAAWRNLPPAALADAVLGLRRQVDALQSAEPAIAEPSIRWAWVVADELGAAMPGGVSYTVDFHNGQLWRASVSLRRSAFDVPSLELGCDVHLSAALGRCEQDWQQRQADVAVGMPPARDPADVEADRQRERELAGLATPKRTRAPRKAKAEPAISLPADPGVGFVADRSPIATVNGVSIPVVEVAEADEPSIGSEAMAVEAAAVSDPLFGAPIDELIRGVVPVDDSPTEVSAERGA